MVRLWWMLFSLVGMVLASDNNLQDPASDKEARFLVPLFPKRYDSRPPPPPPHPGAPLAGPRCSARLETALAQLRSRRSSQPKTIDTPSSQTIELSGYSMHQQLRAAPVDMHVTRMRVRLPTNSDWVRVERCLFDPRNISLDTMLLFRDITISGNVDLYDNNLDSARSYRALRRFDSGPGPYGADGSRDFDDLYRNPHEKRAAEGCNMILRLRKAGIGFHTKPLSREPGRFSVKTDSEFVEPGFISVYAYGCERYLSRKAGRNRNQLPLKRRKRSDEFSFDAHMDDFEAGLSGRSQGWDIATYERPPTSRANYERSKLFRPDDQLDEAEEISREMEDIFTKGIRTLLTTYMKRELQPAIKETLMRNMGYVISYG